ncbi:MAG: GNAT family N-acetyltransferase [Crocinitomicaceae bacterium]
MFHVPLYTKRLKLRLVTPEIYEKVFELPKTDIMDFFGISTDEELSEEKERLERGLQSFNKTFLYFQLIEKESDTVIGWCGYHTWYTQHDRAEIGYGLVSGQYMRKGIMTEALSSVIEYGFDEMNLHRIEAFASPTNVPSVKLLEAHNFQKEGVLKEHYLKDGIYEDSAVYGLIKTSANAEK